MKDNKFHSEYKYLIAVETGYKMFATTDSHVRLVSKIFLIFFSVKFLSGF